MGFRFKLEVPLSRVRAEIIPQCAFNIGGVGVMPFNEVAVVSIHGTHQIGQGRKHAMGQAALESG